MRDAFLNTKGNLRCNLSIPIESHKKLFRIYPKVYFLIQTLICLAFGFKILFFLSNVFVNNEISVKERNKKSQ